MKSTTITVSRRRTRVLGTWLTGAALVGASLLFVPSAAQADSDPVNPQNPATPRTVTADRLPTAQINGVVWSQAVAGDRVYAGGSFTEARPAGSNPGQNTVARNNLMAYDLETGQIISSFSPNANSQVTAVAVSPDESRVYVGGNFTTIDGESRRRIAAFNASTGALVASFAPRVTGSVDAIVATNTTVYAGGSFLGVGNTDRWNLAAFNASNGALLDWAPQATGGTVRALAIHPDGSKIVVGGSFTELNGSSDPGYGLGMVDATSGLNLPMAVNDIVRDATTNGAITTLHADGDYVYGGGYTFGKSGGTLEGVFAADWDGGDVHWINDCHGDSYSVHAQGNVIYQAGHFHYCENIDGFHQGDGGVGDYPYNRGTAMSKAATGTVTWEPDQGRYYTFDGQPAPSQLAWWPSLNAGSATGQNQGPWNVTGNDDYIVMGGEFTRVNGTAQQGLVRYTLKGNAPNNRGPQLSGTNYPIKATSKAAGKVEVNWTANHDQDNENLTYKVYRDTQNAAGLVHSRDLATPYWKLPGMAFTDSVAPGSNHQYRVSATDSSGNVANSPWVSVTAAGAGGTMSAYERAVRNDEPTHYWRLGETNGTGVSDTVGFAPQTAGTGVSRGVPGAIAGDNNQAARFNGTTAGYSATTSTADPPDVFTLEAWFKTNTSSGGKIVGWGNRSTRRAKADRHIYMDNSGRIHFGVKPNADRVSINSSQTYRDSQWHQATATLGNNGMKLYVDGEQVAQNANVTVGEHLSRGLWSIGGDTLASWPSAPSSAYFDGDIDEVAMYRSVLSASRIEAHYAAGSSGQQQNLPPDARFSFSTNGLEATLDAAGSTDSDGSIASYAWDFGDEETGSGQSPSHTYAAAGTYDVTLTVTDDDGATDTLTKQVVVQEAPGNEAPTAAFTLTENGLQVSVDGSTSSDSDGSIASYAWEFGDGGTATGATASHTYTSAGTYQVQLTVTDDDGARDTASQSVDVSDGPPPEPEQIASDAFQRTVTNAWGNADQGGSWTGTGSSGSYQVDGAIGRMTTNGAGNGKAAYLGGVSASETDSTIDLTLNKEPAGGAAFLSYSGRRIDDDNKYSAMVRYLADGTVNLSLRKFVGGAETNLGNTKVDGLLPAANDKLRLRLEVSGASPTQLRAKLWAVGDGQPQAWQLETTDSAAELQGDGAVGVDMYLGGQLSNAPVTAGFDNLDVQGIGDGGGDNLAPIANDIARATVVNKTVKFRPMVTDPDGDTLDYLEPLEPEHGTATWVSGNKIRYVPDKRFTGKDVFTYRVTDENAGTSEAQATVRVRKAKTSIENTLVKPRKVTPRKHARVKAEIRTPRTWPAGKVVVRKGKRVLGRADPARSGDVTVKLKKLKRGTHRVKVHYTGGPATRVANRTVKVRVRRR